MVAAPSDGFHCPSWRSNRLSPEAQELDVDHSGRVVAEKPLHSSPPWEEAVVSKIRTMSVSERCLMLESILCCLQQHSQLVQKVKVSYASIQEVLEPLNLDFSSLEKSFLFHLYGVILRESADANMVRKHVVQLLELSHQSSSDREGISLAIGITSSSHLEQVWGRLEHLGRTRFLRSAPLPLESQLEPDLHWRWVSSTALLCYGQMAMHGGKQVLPWVDNIASRMVYYFTCSSHDSTLKASFLSASIMLVKALSQESSARSYKFTQTPELIQCLLCILEKEPNFLANLFRQKIILVIMELSHLRPRLKPTVKSRILQTCLQSLYNLPPVEMLKTNLPPLELAPDVVALYQKSMQALDLLLQAFISENESMDEICFLLQHTEPWLKSSKSYERKRVVQSIFLLLKYVADYVKLSEEAMPSGLGRQVGLLLLLWRDRDQLTQSHSHQCVYLFVQLLIQQKGSTAEFMHLNKMKNFETKAHKDSELKFYSLVKTLDEHLTVAQHTQLVLTLLQGLCSHDSLNSHLASELLLTIMEDRSIKPEQVAEILQELFQELPYIVFTSILQTTMKAVTVLGTQHTQQTVEVMLSLCPPSERQVIPLWKALATNSRLARKVITLLYMKLKLRPPRELIKVPVQAEFVSLLALSTIYELLYIHEYKATVRWAFAGILLGLLTQLHYLFELDVVEGMSDYQEEALEAKALSPCRTCLEALKGLFWTTNYWEVFAHLKLLRGWELFEHLETYTEGVTLLARAMAHYDCEVKAVLGQAVIFLKSPEERDNIVAILIITEFLSGQELTQYMSRRTIDSFLNLGLNNPNPLVRAMSLKGLSSSLMQPQKVVLLRNQLTRLLDSFLKPQPQDLLGLMEILGDVLHHLGAQGVGAVSVKMAQHLLPLFEAEQEGVRSGAIFLYGDVIYSGGKKFRQALKSHAFQALVPLLFHLADTCPEVVTDTRGSRGVKTAAGPHFLPWCSSPEKTKLTFLRCAILLKWEFRKELFSKLAWGHGPGAENDIFIYMVESNFSSYHQFLMQALAYLDSPNRRLKLTAMKFIGGILQDYFTDLCFYLKKGDVKTLKKCPVPSLCACPPHHGQLRRGWRTIGSLLQTSRCLRRTRTP
ncbi:maestro heat-like repeat family member 5 isoform X2 [Bubalus bubalis]|uniref:maestro heat-like repeat family member 5 isoform X2 n=1 Tax=Bubalus bubalis TaxID=89462 RepID=UPI001E1B81DE|nr:maestro heat-like repeat family member 5 isoform X2 [Bubalus bubalis]